MSIESPTSPEMSGEKQEKEPISNNEALDEFFAKSKVDKVSREAYKFVLLGAIKMDVLRLGDTSKEGITPEMIGKYLVNDFVGGDINFNKTLSQEEIGLINRELGVYGEYYEEPGEAETIAGQENYFDKVFPMTKKAKGMIYGRLYSRRQEKPEKHTEKRGQDEIDASDL